MFLLTTFEEILDSFYKGYEGYESAPGIVHVLLCSEDLVNTQAINELVCKINENLPGIPNFYHARKFRDTSNVFESFMKALYGFYQEGYTFQRPDNVTTTQDYSVMLPNDVTCFEDFYEKTSEDEIMQYLFNISYNCPRQVVFMLNWDNSLEVKDEADIKANKKFIKLYNRFRNKNVKIDVKIILFCSENSFRNLPDMKGIEIEQ